MTNKELIEFGEDLLLIFGINNSMSEFIQASIKALEEKTCVRCKFARDFVSPICNTCSRFYDDMYCMRGEEE